MIIIKNLAIFFMMLLVFALPTDGAVEVAGMSLVKIAGLAAFGLTLILIVMGYPLQAMPNYHALVLLYVAWVVISFTWSEMPEPYEVVQAVSSQQALKSNLYILMITLLIFQLAITPTDIDKLYIAFILGSFWLIYLMVKDYQVTANTVRHEIKDFDANEVSVKLAMVMPLAIHLLIQNPHKLIRLLAMIYLPACMFTILITGSRTGSVIMLLGLSGFLPVIKRSGLVGKSMSLLAVISAVILIANIIPPKTIERIFTTGKEISSGTLNERSVIWANAYEEWEQSPILGHGLGSFRRIINRYNVDYTAHNSYVAITAEQGIVGLVLYLSVIVTVLMCAWRLKGDDKWLLLSVILIIAIGQLSLTLQDKMYIWFGYTLIVLNLYINKKALNTTFIDKVRLII